MNTTLSWTTRFRNALNGAGTFLMRAGLALMALMLTLGMLALGLVMGTALLAWALLRGRQPSLMRRATHSSGFRPTARRRDVIDIEAKEVSS